MINDWEMDLIRRMNDEILGGHAKEITHSLRKIEIESNDNTNSISQERVDELDREVELIENIRNDANDELNHPFFHLKKIKELIKRVENPEKYCGDSHIDFIKSICDVSKLEKILEILDKLLKKNESYGNYFKHLVSIGEEPLCDDSVSADAELTVDDAEFKDKSDITYRYLNTLLTKYKTISDDVIKEYMGGIPKQHLEFLTNNMLEEMNNALKHVNYKIKLEKIGD